MAEFVPTWSSSDIDRTLIDQSPFQCLLVYIVPTVPTIEQKNYFQ